MLLKSLYLQNFRNHSKSSFGFNRLKTFIIGPNTSGKTNLIESIFLLSTGKSFRSEKDFQMIKLGEDLARIKGLAQTVNEPKLELEAVLTNGNVNGMETPIKKFFVNGVSKRRIDFSGLIPVVLFSPSDLDIVILSPFLRREFLDSALEQVDKTYKLALANYEKALRQRNALLEAAREYGRNDKQFEYWDQILIENGEIVTKKREEFIEFANRSLKDIFDFVLFYDKSIISQARLLQYNKAEVGAGVTLVGPHRDDFQILIFNSRSRSTKDIKFFGSRGEQRLAVLQLKLLQIEFIKQSFGDNPILILDDIFSELDENHINLVLKKLGKNQTIITTTHKEFVPKKLLEEGEVIELQK